MALRQLFSRVSIWVSSGALVLACAGSGRSAAAVQRDYDAAVLALNADGDLPRRESFIAHHAGTPQAKQAAALAGQRRIDQARHPDGTYSLAGLETVVELYPLEPVGAHALELIEDELYARLTNPPRPALLLEFLRPKRRSTDFAWFYLDDAARGDAFRQGAQELLAQVLADDRCTSLRRYCGEYVKAEAPRRDEIRGLLGQARKRARRDPKTVKAFARCSRGCYKRCAERGDDACYARCMKPCNAKWAQGHEHDNDALAQGPDED